MSILLYGQKADRTHENHMLRTFIQAIAADWQHADKDIVLIANSMWNGAEIDLVCILPSAVLLVDFKNYQGQLTAAENGPWLINGIEVKGGSKANPFHQLRDNKFSVMDWFKKHRLLLDRNVSHTSAAVIFSGPAIGKPSLSGTVAPWFHTTDMSHCSSLLADLASPKLTIYPSDIEAIIRALGVRSIKEDYGQANRELIVPAAVTAPITPLAITEAETKAETKAETATVINNPAPKQTSLSNMFKTAAAVGGIFLTLAVISQIYPTVGLSNTPTEVQVLPVSTIGPSASPSSLTPRATQHIVAPNNGSQQIKTRAAANYIGQQVTACGPVAQISSFKKGFYLNFDNPYPQHSMTVVLWQDQVEAVEGKLGKLNNLQGTEVCATGVMEQYKQHPQIKIADSLAIDLLSKTWVQTNKAEMDGNAERIEAYRAPFYVGKQVMACGVLAGTTKFAKGTYLSLDKKYPNQTLTLVLWDESVAAIEAKFGSLNGQVGRTFCALGTVEKYKKSLQIQIENPQFLRLMQ